MNDRENLRKTDRETHKLEKKSQIILRSLQFLIRSEGSTLLYFGDLKIK